MGYHKKTSFKIHSMIGLLIGSLSIGTLLPGCHRGLPQESKPSVYVSTKAEQNETKTLAMPPPYKVMTTQDTGVISESLVFGPSAPEGLKNATLKITLGSSLKQLNNFHLSLSRPGGRDQEMSVSCQSKECRLTTNTLRNPQLIKYALTLHLKRVLSEVKESKNKLPMTKTPGLSLADSWLPDSLQLGVIGVSVLVLLGFIIAAIFACTKVTRYLFANPGQVQNDLEMATRGADLPAATTQTIARRATIVVVDAEGKVMVGLGDPEEEIVPAGAPNADLVSLYWAVVGEG